ncbi:UDP-N-acetylmuramate--L-alanine ligase [Pseudoflavitalea sp. G-6-1-2]|uniref:UDP-N-acetylmuramate--L-alanine ligase n=1 Tax=Pseudoflavitalea sp. G-6-1-2 TaxID=2728841 RepID=UPI00146F57BF|nr:UDP-N-acetylmuramate--L-alanine ligase [Pseudoflavitalea sp. G-6-1-2]NML20755.1 UDP-N-acetylmuramate--L-alanine ligase [Pseudoflavitalea sp. G-6-1-2]
MVQLEDIKKVYFIGIGGIGMSAIARYFKFHGREVSGYDKTETVLTKQLTAEGIPVHYDDNLELAPKDADLVVYTPAIPKNHSELNWYQNSHIPLMKRSEVLGVITAGSFNICVAGTHGKTTITTMIAHILRDTGYGCNAFLGGVAVNYNSNYWSNERNVCVVEADEYDRSFLRLSPDIAVITAMDADHLDIYGTPEAMEEAYIEFSRRVKQGGWMISKHGLKRSDALESTHQITYSLHDKNADIHTDNIRMENGSYHFDVITRLWQLKDITLNMGGLHNVENITAAIMIAHHLGIADDKIKAAVASFKGVKRRFEYMIKTPSLVFVDDYAHHPEELRALISGARKLFPDKKCTVIFQPHLFTRTRDFAKEFAESLDLADEVVLLPIYPARELPIEGVTSSLILDQMTLENKQILDKPQILEYIKQNQKENWLLITAGAGDIDTLLQPIKTMLTQ